MQQSRECNSAVAFLMRRWHDHHRGGPEPTVLANRTAMPESLLPLGRVVDLPHTRIAIGA
jgi:hypothetical protein